MLGTEIGKNIKCNTVYIKEPQKYCLIICINYLTYPACRYFNYLASSKN